MQYVSEMLVLLWAVDDYLRNALFIVYLFLLGLEWTSWFNTDDASSGSDLEIRSTIYAVSFMSKFNFNWCFSMQ